MTDLVEQETRDVGDERKEFLENRRNGIMATDTPKILGLSRWGTALTVYRDKTEEAEPSPMSLPAWLGLKLQDTVGELYTAAMGTRLRAAHRQYTSKRYHWLGCHLDFRARGKPALLVECKTKAYMKGWGEDGSAIVPPDVWAQVQHEMLVADAEVCHVAVLFGHHTFRVYIIKRDPEFLDLLVPKLSEFWHVNVLQRIPPLATDSEWDDEAIREMHPVDTDPIKSATPEQELLVREYAYARFQKQQAEKVELEKKHQLEQLIGKASGLQGGFGVISWRQSRDSKSIGWEQVAKTYANMIEALIEIAAPGDDDAAVAQLAHVQALYPTVVDLYTEAKVGTRRFLPTLNYELTEETA